MSALDANPLHCQSHESCTKHVILEIYAVLADSVRTTQPYQTHLDPLDLFCPVLNFYECLGSGGGVPTSQRTWYTLSAQIEERKSNFIASLANFFIIGDERKAKTVPRESARDGTQILKHVHRCCGQGS